MEKQIAEWKRKYKTIFRKKFGDVDVYYRPLSAEEFNYVLSLEEKVSETEIEDAIVNMCLLHPKDLREKVKKDLVFTDLASFIMRSSAYDDATLLSEMTLHREDRDKNIFKVLIGNIIAHIPAYKPEDLLDKNLDQLLEIASIAELVPVNKEIMIEEIVRDPSKQAPPPIPKQGIKPGKISTPKKFSAPGEQFDNSINKTTNALQQAMAQHGKIVKPITQVVNDKADEGSLQDKIRKMNTQLNRKFN